MNLIYDNIIFDLQKFGGISTYWYELISRLQNERDVHMKFIEAGHSQNNVMRQQLQIAPQHIKVYNRGGILLERFRKIPLENPHPDSIFHSSYFRNPTKKSAVKKVVTIHDLTHNLFYSKARAMLHNYNKTTAIRESDLIITVSENTKRDVLKFHPHIPENKIITIYNGASKEFSVIDDLPKSAHPPVLLYIGSREHYKNFNFAVEVASQLKEFYLYVVSAPLNRKEEQFISGKLSSRYKVFSGISVQELNKLYNQAYCLFYPSSYEGFGIPIVEAMQAGCPVVAHKTSSIPEVAGDAALFFDQLDVEHAIFAIKNVEAQRNKLRQVGFTQSQKFSWQKCYEQTFRAYRSL